jgi:hypothetical protein
MLKGSLQFILTIFLGYIAQLYFPFWAMAAVAAVVAVFFKFSSSAASFAAGFAAAFLLWSAYAYTLNVENLNLLSGKMGELFEVGSSYLPYATGMVGGLLGGFGAMTGSLFRKIFE